MMDCGVDNDVCYESDDVHDDVSDGNKDYDVDN